MDNFVVISGCSGGGKSTLLERFSAIGHHVVREPGRRIVADERARGGKALPWEDPVAFARRAIRMSLTDRLVAARQSGWVFFDRGLIDAASALDDLTGKTFLARLARRHRYHKNMFMAPPWPEIYVRDEERQHDLADALIEYERLCRIYPSLGYQTHTLPKASLADRADYVLATLGPPPR